MSAEERKQLEEELATLQQREFMIQMNDHWSADDYDMSRSLNQRIREIERKLNAEE